MGVERTNPVCTPESAKANFTNEGGYGRSYRYLKNIMIGEAYRRGNTIGMHTFTHDYATCYASVDAYFADLGQIAQVVKDQIGYVPYLVRFPGGSSNTVSRSYCPGIMAALLFLGGVITLAVGMLGEYVGRIYVSVNKKPQYVVRDVIDRRGEGGRTSCSNARRHCSRAWC